MPIGPAVSHTLHLLIGGVEHTHELTVDNFSVVTGADFAHLIPQGDYANGTASDPGRVLAWITSTGDPDYSLNNFGKQIFSNQAQQAVGGPVRWRAADAVGPNGQFLQEWYSLSQGLAITSEPVDVVVEEPGESRRVLDSTWLSGFVEAQQYSFPAKVGNQLKWIIGIPGEGGGGNFIGTVAQPYEVGDGETAIYSHGGEGTPYLLYRDQNSSMWAGYLKFWNGETWPPADDGSGSENPGSGGALPIVYDSNNLDSGGTAIYEEDGEGLPSLLYRNSDGQLRRSGPMNPWTPGQAWPEPATDGGEDGAAATVQIGTVTTGAPGTAASVTNSGTENAAVLDFTIPAGATGAAGASGGGSGGAAFLSGMDADKPATSTTDSHYLALDNGKLWKWAGAWILAGTLMLAGAGGGGSTPAEPLIRDIPVTGRTYDFDAYAIGPIAGQNGWTGPGDVTDNRLLQINNQFTTINGPTAPGTFAEGEITITIDKYNPYVLVRSNHSATTGRSYAAWLYAGDFGLTLDLGVLSPTGVIASQGAGPFISIPGNSEYLKLRMVVERKTLLAWAWSAADPMPAQPMLTFDVSGHPLGDGQTILAFTKASTPAVIESIRIQDGLLRPNAVQTQANFAGRWWAAYRSGRLGMATITQGAESLLQADGNDLVASVYRDPDTTQTPYFSVKTGSESRVRIAGPTSSGWSNVVLATGLTGLNDVSVVVDGFHELDPVWDGAALLIGGFTSSGGSTVPLNTGKPIVLHVGDSIGAGVLLRGSGGGTNPNNSSAVLAYTRLATSRAGGQSLNAAYGGVGVAASTTGSGGVPGALGNQLAYHSRHLDPAVNAGDVKAITVNLGTNDSGRGIPESTFRTDYDSLLTLLLGRYPNAKILALRPFGGYYASAIQASALAAGARVQYVDTTGWVTTFTDGVHPDAAGNDEAATQLTPILTAILS